MKVSKIPNKQLITEKPMKGLGEKNRLLNISKKKMSNVQKNVQNL